MRLIVWGDVKMAGDAYSAEIVRRLQNQLDRPDVESEYLGYADLVQETGVSERTWRRALEDPVDPLPCYRIGGRTLFKRVEWKAWMQRRRVVGSPELDEIVRAALDGIRR